MIDAVLSALGSLEGLRAAEPGEFTRRAFGNGRIDLTEAEGLADLIEAETESQRKAALAIAEGGLRKQIEDWQARLLGLSAEAERARAHGFEPVFHHHMGTRVQTPTEIERLLDGTDVALLVDSGHLTAAGGDPVRAMRDWRDRVRHLHVKDVRLDVLRASPDWGGAWRAGAFCELGTGNVDLAGFLAELDGYSGWLVVEQDWVPGPDDDPIEQIEAQARNRRWLAEHAGI